MKPDEVRKLLGGYATGTLTEQERARLLETALQDQQVFDALAGEQALKDLLDDPASRKQLLDALAEPRAPLLSWLRRPAVLAFAGGLATLVVVIGVRWMRDPQRTGKPNLVAHVQVSESREPKDLPPVLPSIVPEERPAPGRAKEAGMRTEHPAEHQPEMAATPAPLMAEFRAARQETAPVSAAEAGAPRLRYTVLRREASGAETEVSASTMFEPSDSFRLRIEPAVRGYLSVSIRQGEGAAESLVAAQPVEPGNRYFVPASGWMGFPSSPAERRVTISLDQRPSEAIGGAEPAAQPSAPSQATAGRYVVEFTLKSR